MNYAHFTTNAGVVMICGQKAPSMPDVESRTSQDFKYVATVGKSYGIFHRQRVKSPTKIEGNIGQHVGPGIAKKLKMRVKIMGLELNLHTLTSLSHTMMQWRCDQNQMVTYNYFFRALVAPNYTSWAIFKPTHWRLNLALYLLMGLKNRTSQMRLRHPCCVAQN